MRTGATLAEAAPASPLRRAVVELARELTGVPEPAPAAAVAAPRPPLIPLPGHPGCPGGTVSVDVTAWRQLRGLLVDYGGVLTNPLSEFMAAG